MTNISSSSKVMGVRVPLPLYMDILQKATDNKMSITDYVLQILLNKPIQQPSAGSDIVQANLKLSGKVNELETKNKDLSHLYNSTLEKLSKAEYELKEKNLEIRRAKSDKDSALEWVKKLDNQLDMIFEWIIPHSTLWSSHKGIVKLIEDYRIKIRMQNRE